MRKPNNMQARGVKILLMLTAVLGLVLMLAACGKKNMPKPPHYAEPPVATALLVENVENDVLTLAWEIPPAQDEYNLKFFHVYLAQDALATLCLTCPPNFVLVGDSRTLTQAGGTLAYTFQIRIQEGFRYVFKVNAVGREGREGADSNYAVYNYEE